MITTRSVTREIISTTFTKHKNTFQNIHNLVWNFLYSIHTHTQNQRFGHQQSHNLKKSATRDAKTKQRHVRNTRLRNTGWTNDVMVVTYTEVQIEGTQSVGQSRAGQEGPGKTDSER